MPAPDVGAMAFAVTEIRLIGSGSVFLSHVRFRFLAGQKLSGTSNADMFRT
jgi:hypothetical protein